MTATENRGDRFSRSRQLLGETAFARVAGAEVCVVGIGAVGGYVVEALARGGVGRLRLVDFDTVATSNINRQILALDSTVGRSKVALAAERIHAINPRCSVETRELFCTSSTVDEILSPAPDLVIDAIDALNPKTDLLEAAWRRQLPLLSSMGAALRTDATAVRSGDLFSSSGCPLARHLRRRLRRRGIDHGIACVYSTEKVTTGIGDREDFGDHGRGRNILGSLPTIPGIFGLTLANSALLHLAGQHRLHH